jgi:L-serine/L-threonine ammonia-lyase
VIAVDHCTQFVLDMYGKISLKLCGVNQLKEGGCQQFVSSSGGNAGVAAACVSQALGIPCTVFVPEWAQPACINIIRDNGAQVQVQTIFIYKHH